MTLSRCAAAIALAIGCALSAPRASAQDRERCIAAFDEGQAHRLRGELRAGRASFVDCARDACPVPLRKDCAQSLQDLDAELPTIVLGARDAAGHDIVPSAVYVDGQRVAALDGRALAEDPGQHEIRFEHLPDAAVIEHVLLRVGEHNREILATFPAPAPQPEAGSRAQAPAGQDARAQGGVPQESARSMGWVYATGALGLLGLASFAYFGVSGLAWKQHLVDTCAPGCQDSDVARLRFDYVTADVSLAVGVLSLGVAGVLLFSAPTGSGVTVSASQRSAAIRWIAAF